MIDHLDLAGPAQMEVPVTRWLCNFVKVQDGFCCWEQWKRIPAAARESREIKFWANLRLDQVSPY